ncbi:MAG: C39 family peptidase [Clostridia bacterium]|nr:C39 family peptidase [Clostridia bacterium]
MKKKLVTIVLLSLIIAVTIFGFAGSALAEEINLTLMYYQSENFSEEEIDFALTNLQYKLEDEELPRLIRIEEVYDFNEEPLYGLYEFNNYHMLVIRETGSVLERGDGNSAYFGNNKGLKYYGGYEEYYIYEDGAYKNLLTNEVVSQSKISQMESRMKELRELDYQDYLEALSTPMPLGADNRGRITKLGKNIVSILGYLYGSGDHLYNYFAQEINIDYQWNNALNNIKLRDYSQILYTVDGFAPKFYGSVYSRNLGKKLGQNGYELGYDLLYPQNVYNACSLVAMVMLLQYYYRTELNEELLYPIEFEEIQDPSIIDKHPLYSQAEETMSVLYTYIKPLANGVATYVEMDSAFDKYFKENDIDATSTHFTSYTNIKSAVEDGHPSILTIGAGRGFDINNNEQDLSGHNVVVYGYTTNFVGVIDEFICHAGWHTRIGQDDTIAECAKLYVNKFYAAGNVHLSY